MQVEGRNKELENEVLAMRKAAEQAVAEMRTLQNVRGRRVGNGALVADARLYKGLADYSVHCVVAAHSSAHASTRFTHRSLSTNAPQEYRRKDQDVASESSGFCFALGFEQLFETASPQQLACGSSPLHSPPRCGRAAA